MSYSYETRMKVAFHDLDPLQIVWHGNYLKYFDVTRFGLFADAGIDLYDYMISKQVIFPITRSAVKHIAPLHHFDEFICRAVVTEARYKIAMNFTIRLAKDDTVCARGSSDQITVRLPGMEMEFEVPPEITQALGF